MKVTANFLCVVALASITHVSLFAQETTPPTTTSPTTTTTTPSTAAPVYRPSYNEAMLERARQIDFERRSQALDMLSRGRDAAGNPLFGSPRPFGIPTMITSPRLTREQNLFLAPETNVKDRYALFLKEKHTGIARLFPDGFCGDTSKVARADEECRFMPPLQGGAAYYSFRHRSYQPTAWADVLYKDDKLVTGFAPHTLGLIIDLGDKPIEQVSLALSELTQLQTFTPPTDLTYEAIRDKDTITPHITRLARTPNAQTLQPNHTYVVRSIAYRSNGFEDSWAKRGDSIIALRVVAIDKANNSATIIWRELARTRSPKLKRSKNR